MQTYNDAMAGAHRVTSKYAHYGALYDLLLPTLPAAPTVLEIGIANGGSLETWRRLLGPEARIIGVDLNPRAVELRQDGYEVFILDTGDSRSWARLYGALGPTVDLLVDDGGHTNQQQINAIVHGIDLVRDGGWIVVEDLHASFMREFGNPSRHSAAAFLNDVIADLHRSHPRSCEPPTRPNLAHSVSYVVSSTSWSALRVGPWDQSSREETTAGLDQSLMDYDHRWDSSTRLRRMARFLPRTLTHWLGGTVLRLTQLREMSQLYRSDSTRRP